MKALKVLAMVTGLVLAAGLPVQSAQAFCCGFFGGGFSFGFGFGGGWGWGGPYWGSPYWGGLYGGYPAWAGYGGYPFGVFPSYGYPLLAYAPSVLPQVVLSTPEVPEKK